MTAPNGASLYLGGSMHGLRSVDYPLPSAYNRAFDASSALVFEDDPNTPFSEVRRLFKGGFYPKSDSLKNHVDPRTYSYLQRFFSLERVPESEWSKYKPWMLTYVLGIAPATNQLGIEAYLQRRARANHKPIFGLESAREHLNVLSGMSDKLAELVLLFNFVPQGSGANSRDNLMTEWRNGNVDAIAQMDRQEFRDLPSYEARLIDQRNRNWIPKIEGYLQHHRNYFVLVGAGHLGGQNGVLALLRRRGYQLEQL
ncbi:MAG TPA: TraB/GumN family protein [Chthoniobacterales bacterium]